MKNRYLFVGIAATLLTLSACAKNTPPSESGKSAPAVINGKPVSQAAFDAYVAAVTRKPAAEATPEQRAQILDQLIAMQLAADVAVKNGSEKTPETTALLALARLNVLSENTLKKHMDAHPITDAEIQAEYDTQVAAMGRQYRARHILVDSKAAADSVIEKLKSGTDFAKLAEKESSDGSAKQGGDLGWFSLQAMAPQFSQAVAALEKGKYTQAPVQTQYGWHVIRLEDVRIPEAPALDAVKDQVKGFVQRKKLQAYLDELRKGAKVEKNLGTTDTPAPAPTK